MNEDHPSPPGDDSQPGEFVLENPVPPSGPETDDGPLGALPSPGTPKRRTKERNGFLEALVLVVVALVLAMTLKTYVAEAYEIKGRSMEPTFLSGQRVVVLKAFYEVQRYDVVVFASKEDPSKDLVKRVVGLPGETIRISGGRVYVDGRLLPETYTRHDRRDLLDGPLETRVPEDHYYVLGDNRPDSHDSRYFESIPARSVRGKVVLRWWPLGEFKSF